MKTLTNLFFIQILFSAVLISSCTVGAKNDSNQPEAILVSVDSLNASWDNGWNQNDQEAIAGMFTEKTVIMEGDWIVEGGTTIMEKWVINQMPKMDNFKTKKISAGVSSDMAYYSGTYSLDVVRNDSIVGTSDGNYTTIWKKQTDNSWKVEMLHMGTINPE